MAISKYIYIPEKLRVRTCELPARVVPKKNSHHRVHNLIHLRIVLVLIFLFVGFWRYHRHDEQNSNEDLVESTNGVFQQIHKINEQLAFIEREVESINEKHNKLNEDFYNEKQMFESRVENKIESALKKYDADKTGLIDFALETGGGRIVSIPGTTNFEKTWSVPLLGPMGVGIYNPPETILRPGNQPGECFSFAGSEGRFRIRLAAPIQITAVTLEHAPFDIVPDIRSAPRDFVIYGLLNEDVKSGVTLGNFQFNLHHFNSIQTFYIPTTYDQNDESLYQVIELHVKSNQGHPKYTCLYRFRVHGNY